MRISCVLAHDSRFVFRVCTTGVAALSERHLEESKRAKEFIGELEKLRRSKLGCRSSLADLRREARANTSSFSDIQVLH